MKRGLRRAILYALTPNELGLCGSQNEGEKGQLLRYLAGGKVSDARVRKILGSFLAYASYLQLIAKNNEIDDWLDERVAEAYWIGNHLLEGVKVGDLRNLVRSFAGKGQMTQEVAEALAARIPYRAVPHHSFHVFMIGSITGKSRQALFPKSSAELAGEEWKELRKGSFWCRPGSLGRKMMASWNSARRSPK